MDFFSIADVLALLTEARRGSEDHWLLLAVTFVCALRRAEAVGLRADNIDGDYIVVKRGKGSKPVKLKLLDLEHPLLNVMPALIELVKKTPFNQRLFPISARTLQRLVHRYGERAGLPKFACHTHTLRHSIIQFCRDHGMELEEIQEISGHLSLNSLRVYLHPTPAVIHAKFKQALDSIPV